MNSVRITIFGGMGFVGRHLTARLLSAGHHLSLVARHASGTAPAKTHGQFSWLYGDVLKRDTVAAAVRGADAVINLVGAVSLPDARAFFDLHETGARNVAEEACEAGAERLIHVSALGIDTNAPSAADRSKAAGERAVLEAFPEAVILRPSLVFGDDDHLFNRIAAMSRVSPVIPLVGGATLFQPVHVDDLAAAVTRTLELPESSGITYQIGGPEVYTLERLVRLLLAALGRKRLVAPLPYALAVPLGSLLGLLPHAPFNREQVALMMTDKVVDAGASGLADLDIHPRSLREWISRPGHRYRHAPAA
jgi:uncharacterized protein YbjT (DUF2867 family)